ncbi:hypothetical protein ABDJ41_10780 [Pedobacter sp. ASV1-7]|uniref:hypothetical protein n=1 Tax=Pedobacter sp. ASV1-7 TaxID=3145237 RepID=UPI0032E90124
MQLIVSSFFSEVGIDFKISHKVNLYIRNKFIENVMKTYGLDKDNPNRSLNLNVTTTAKTTVVDVKGPVFDKRNDFVSYGLWLPYKNIVNAKYPLQAYLKYYFDACVEVFKKYNVS